MSPWTGNRLQTTADPGATLYERVGERLRERVRHASRGEKLSEWSLAREYGCSRSWARACVTELVNEGLLERAAGRGTFVTERAVDLSTIRLVTSSHSRTMGTERRAFETLKTDYPNLRIETMPHSLCDGDVRCIISHNLPHVASAHQPITPLLERYPELSPENFRDDAVDIFRHNGRLLALPLYSSAAVMHYNPNLFDEAGVPYPDADWTWEQMIETGRALHQPERGRIGLWIPEPRRLFLAMVWSLGGEVYSAPDGPWDLCHEAAYEAAALFARVAQYAEVAEGRGSALAFADGRIAMLPLAGVMTSWIGRGAPDWMKCVPMPRGRTRVTWYMAEGLGLGRVCRNLDLAAEFIRELIKPEAQKVLHDAGLRTLAWKGIGGDDAEHELYQTEKRWARVTYPLSDYGLRAVLGTQLSRLKDPRQAQKFCQHTEELVNAIVAARPASVPTEE